MSIFLGKRSVELKNTTIPKTTDFLKKDGSVAMAGNLNLGNYAIDNLKTYPENNKNAASKKYVDDECGKLLDLDANRPLTGDLNMNDNAIVGIYDINASNSVPSKKFVRDENAAQNTKITQNANNITSITADIGNVKNDVTDLKNKIIFSHFFHFNYTNPVASLPKNPEQWPTGYPNYAYYFHPDYNDDTKITLIALGVDSDTSVSSNLASLGVDIKLFDNTGGSAYKTLIPDTTKIGKYRKGTNLFRFDDLSFKFKDLDAIHFRNWNGFLIPITCSWTNNETRLFFSVDYY